MSSISAGTPARGADSEVRGESWFAALGVKGRRAFRAAFAGYMLDAFDLIVLDAVAVGDRRDLLRRHRRHRRAVDGHALGLGGRRHPRRPARRPDRPRAHADAQRRRLLAVHVPVGPRHELRDADGLPRLPGASASAPSGASARCWWPSSCAPSRAGARWASSRARGRSGWALAVVAYLIAFELFPEETAWRVLMCLGILPALLILYVRSRVEDPEVYREVALEGRTSGEVPLKQILCGKLLKTTIAASLLATGIQGGYYAMFTWIPTYLKKERDLTIVGTSGYLFVVIAGAFLGYLSAGWVHDRLGRRRAFALFAALRGRVAGRVLRGAVGLEHDAAARRLPAGVLRLRLLLGLRLLPGRAVPDAGARDRRGLLLQRRPRHRGAVPGHHRLPRGGRRPRRGDRLRRLRLRAGDRGADSCCPRRAGARSGRTSEPARRAARRPGVRPRAAALRGRAGVAGARAGRHPDPAPPPRARRARVAHGRLGDARHDRALRHAHRRALPSGLRRPAARRARGHRARADADRLHRAGDRHRRADRLPRRAARRRPAAAAEHVDGVGSRGRRAGHRAASRRRGARPARLRRAVGRPRRVPGAPAA